MKGIAAMVASGRKLQIATWNSEYTVLIYIMCVCNYRNDSCLLLIFSNFFLVLLRLPLLYL